MLCNGVNLSSRAVQVERQFGVEETGIKPGTCAVMKKKKQPYILRFLLLLLH
jgi:hypothetical protein